MQLKLDTVDLDQTKENWPAGTAFKPALVVPRRGDARPWVTACAPIDLKNKIKWCSTAHDEFIRIPLFPYLLQATGDLALAHMLQLGLYCAGQLPGPLSDLWIVTGRPVEILTDENSPGAMRYWVGFAALAER